MGNCWNNNKKLTDREKEVRDMLLVGLRPKEIATQLNISVRTCEWYKEEVLRKYGVKNLVLLLRVAYQIEEKTQIMEPQS